MATRRKHVRRPAPKGLAEISGLVLMRWRVYGPEIAGDDWEGSGDWRHRSETSWAEWAAAYAACREEMLAKDAARRASQMKHPTLARQLEKDPPKVPACERIYQAMLRGEDPEKEQAAILAELRENDPRRVLEG